MIGKQAGRIGILTAVVLVVGMGNTKAQQPGPAESVGEKVDDAFRDVKRGVKDAAQGLRDRFAQARDSVQSMGIEARIYGRIHWDKSLNSAMIDLAVDRAGVVTLRGTVPNSSAKEKAVMLARDTVGVSQVIDELALSPLSPTLSPAPVTTRP